MAEDQDKKLQDEGKAHPHFPEDSHAPPLPQKIPPPQIVDMEVHKHPHHVMHKKKWTEYLLEFFMIFFAVAAGFFAENIREKMAEHHREKEYIHSLLLDLKSGTAMISKTIANNERYYRDDSTLLRLLQSPSRDTQTLQSIYALYPQTEKFIVEINDPKTFEQLKNTGDIRLIRKQVVLDSMSGYYQKINRIGRYRDEIQTLLENTYNLSDRVFDNYTVDINGSAAPLTSEPSLLKEYTNKLFHLTRDLKKYDRFLELLRTATTNFIRTIEEEYDIEND